MIVATDNLSKEYDGVYRVQELDIRIKEGDIYGFLGPNGAGKSTTMKMLLGLVKPTSGTIEIMGKPFNEKNRRDIPVLLWTFDWPREYGDHSQAA